MAIYLSLGKYQFLYFYTPAYPLKGHLKSAADVKL